MSWLSEYSGYFVLFSFFTAFIGIALWAYWPLNREKLEQHRNIPFNGGEQ